MIVDLQTLAGGDLPAWLGTTRQPISAQDARRLAQNAGLSRLVTGTPSLPDTGALSDTPAPAGTAGLAAHARKAAAHARKAAAHAITGLCGPDAARLLTGPASMPLDVGREHRLVTPAIRRALEYQYPTCAVEGCDIPAPLCQADHARPWALGGTTSLRDMTLACGFHNRFRARHPDRVQTIRHPDGRITYRILRPGRWPP